MALKSCGGTKGKIYKIVINSKADLLFIATKNRDLYLIPVINLKNKYILNLGKNIKNII